MEDLKALAKSVMSNFDVIKKQFLAYGAVGLLGTAIHFLVFVLIYQLTRIPTSGWTPPVKSSMVGYRGRSDRHFRNERRASETPGC